MMVTSSTKRREMIHWLWLWTLALIAISVLYGRALGHEALPLLRFSDPPQTVAPIPIPNVDRPDWFRYPDEDASPDFVTLEDVIRFNRIGDHRQAVIAWRHLDALPHSESWKQVGLGVSYLKLEKLEQAVKCLNEALALDSSNAVAEYFLGRACQQQGRQVPFWYERNLERSFRLASHRDDFPVESRLQSADRSILPHYRDDGFDVEARTHFRRAIELAPICDLSEVIEVVPPRQPRIQLTQSGVDDHRVTVRDLLNSWREADFVEKARRELAGRVAAPMPASNSSRVVVFGTSDG